MEYIGIFTLLLLGVGTFAVASLRQDVLARSKVDWVVDIASLVVHILLLPLVQGLAVLWILEKNIPSWKGSLASSALLSFGLYLALDYLWYWNHRIFHADTPLWNLHSTHHAPEKMDVFVTARNSLLSHFAMVYFWFIGVFVFLLDDPTIFLGIATVGTVINFWGHSPFNFPRESKLERMFSLLIVTPRDHYWHHSRENPRCNYGTVINIWDRLHGTFHRPTIMPQAFGDPNKKTIWNQLIWPF